MAGMMEQLLELMEEQIERHNELLGLSLEEKDAIISNDIETLQKLVNLKNIVISQNNKLEKKRLSLINDISTVMASDKTDIDLTELIEFMKGRPEEENLKDVGRRLRAVVNELKEANDLNKDLLEQALMFVEYSLNALRTTLAPEVNVPVGKPSADDVSFGTFDTIG